MPATCGDQGARRPHNRALQQPALRTAAERAIVRQTFSSVKGSDLGAGIASRRSPCRIPDRGEWASRARGGRTREPRSPIAVRQHACPRSMGWRTCRSS